VSRPEVVIEWPVTAAEKNYLFVHVYFADLTHVQKLLKFQRHFDEFCKFKLQILFGSSLSLFLSCGECKFSDHKLEISQFN